MMGLFTNMQHVLASARCSCFAREETPNASATITARCTHDGKFLQGHQPWPTELEGCASRTLFRHRRHTPMHAWVGPSARAARFIAHASAHSRAATQCNLDMYALHNVYAIVRAAY